MGLDSRCFEYCNEIGLMEERYTHQYALNSLIEEVKKVKSADPAFVAQVSKLTLNSYEVSVRSCIVYYYEADIDYVVSGNIRSTKVSDFGYRHISDSLHITEFEKNAKYRILKSSYDIPYDVYHEECLFTKDQMKKALENKLGEYLPKNYSSWQSKRWSVSAYIVPTLVVIMKYNGKDYFLYYNLHNGYYHWEWPTDPVIIKKAKNTKKLAKFFRVVTMIAGVLGAIVGFANGAAPVGIAALAFAIVAFVMNKKASGKDYKDVFKKNKEKSVFSCVIPEFIFLVLSVIALFISVAV